ncbi:MAG: 3-deoxy-manno-octulosonate cytidylyltransferase [Ignavibacteriales bacterium]|nr:3-deoxy-manno-octulosonate cytidylyltransferase [Ignavibacteriales bacterium]
MILGVIPARFASSRLLGKPLAMIGDKPMIQHTYESAKKSKLISKLVIAVDDKRILDVARDFKAEVLMTPNDIQTGSDRIAYVTKDYPDAQIIVNIQGDEPFINAKMIDEAIEPLLFDKKVDVSTLAFKINNVDDLKNPSMPKIVFDYHNFALYFSRSTIPFVRGARTNLEKIKTTDIYKHVGLYVFRRNALFKFTSLESTDLEKAEKLEQLRMLEHGMKIKIVITDYESLSVDTPEDLERARKYYKKIIDKK